MKHDNDWWPWAIIVFAFLFVLFVYIKDHTL